MHVNDLVGFLQRVDDLKLAADRISAHLEHATQTKDVRRCSHNYLPSWVPQNGQTPIGTAVRR
jgi:hypothetical protein